MFSHQPFLRSVFSAALRRFFCQLSGQKLSCLGLLLAFFALPLPVRSEGQHENQVTANMVYQVLVGEIALRRGEKNVAFDAWRDLAEKSGDTYALKRAIEIGMFGQQHEKALVLARQWQKIEPDSAEAARVLDGLLVSNNRLDELKPRLEATLSEQAERRPGLFLQLNRTLARPGNQAEVWKLMQQLSASYEQLPEAQYALALAAERAQHRSEALTAVRRAKELRPMWTQPWLLESQLLATKEPQAAIALLREFLELPGAKDKFLAGNLEIRQSLARLLATTGKMTEAKEMFRALSEEWPENPELRYSYVILSMRLNELSVAKPELERLLRTPGANLSSAHFFLGQVSELQQRTEEAISHYQQVMHGEHWLSAHLRLARLYKAQEKDRVALETLTLVLKKFPEDPEALYEAGMLAEQQGELDVMEAHFRHLLKVQPDSVQALNALGYSLADHHRKLDEAYQLVSKALALRPEDPLILDSVGWVLCRQGRLEEARQHLGKAYALKPEPEIAAHLGEVLWLLQQKTEAQKIWAGALTKQGDQRVLRETLRRLAPELLTAAP